MPPKKKEKKKEFVWSDDEVELLLNIANDYKVSKAAESMDWESVKSKYNESVKSKYNDICDLFIAALPDDESDVMTHRKRGNNKADCNFKVKGNKT